MRNRVGRLRILATVAALASGSATFAATPPVQLSIQFDYSLDSTGFFTDPLRRQRLEQAAGVFSYTDALAAITPSATNTWTATFPDPATGATTSRSDMTVPASNLVVFVGARSLDPGIWGGGAMGSATASGDPAFVDNVTARGQANVSGPAATDVGPWGGSVAFSTTANWYFGTDTAPQGMQSFLGVAMRELARVLGFGTSDSWHHYADAAGFSGPASMARYLPWTSGAIVPLATDQTHWRDDVIAWLSDYGVPPLLKETLPRDPYFTPLDHAGMKDVGWEAHVDPYVPFGLLGDADGDGDVDLDDQGIWASNFTGSLTPGTGNAFLHEGDFDNDKDVDLDDQGIWAANFTGSLAPGGITPAVPEPTAGVPALLLAVVGSRRVRRITTHPVARPRQNGPRNYMFL